MSPTRPPPAAALQADAPRAGALDTLSLRGTVFDAYSGEPIPASGLRARRSGALAVADTAGRFVLRLTPGAPDTVVVSALGYDSLEVALGGEERGTFEIVLSLRRGADYEALRPPDAFELEGLEVEVESRARAVEFTKLHQGRLWQRKDFERYTFTTQHPLDILRWSGMVFFVREGTGAARDHRCVVIRVPGCALIVLNGVRVSSERLASVPPEAIESFVILRPADATTVYGTLPQGSAGAVVVFTRTGG